MGLMGSLFCELFVHCWVGLFLTGGTSVEVFWFVGFRPVVSFVVSTHSTEWVATSTQSGFLSTGLGHRVLAREKRDGQ